MVKIYVCLPIQFVGAWPIAEQAHVYAVLRPLAERLHGTWTLAYTQRSYADTLSAASSVMHTYSASVSRNGLVEVLIADTWSLPGFVHGLVTCVANEATREPTLFDLEPVLARASAPPASPLETGRWYLKRAFERTYGVHDWRHVVRFVYGRQQVRCKPDVVRELLRLHRDAYFQLDWNPDPFVRDGEARILASGRACWVYGPLHYGAGSTVRLRICYAQAPQRDTTVVLYDGYGLPTRNRWWQQAIGKDVPLAPQAPARCVVEGDQTTPG